jgi:hypothetical protein
MVQGESRVELNLCLFPVRFRRLLPPYHDHRPLNDDRLFRGWFRPGRHFPQGLLEGREIGGTLLLGSLASGIHRCGLPRHDTAENLSARLPDGFW